MTETAPTKLKPFISKFEIEDDQKTQMKEKNKENYIQR